MSDDDEKAMLPTTFCFPAVTEVSLGPRYSVRCHVRFFLIPCLFPEYCGQAQEKTLPAPFLFSLSFFSFCRSRDSKKNFFFTSYTQIGRGFGTALTSRRLTNHHIHVDAKGRGIKNNCGELAGKTFPGVLLGHLVSLCVLFQYVAFSLVCETSFLVYVI
uniref:Uncharacterized protein n=1 Tax=Rhipicephalus zambeziensis TaxID=60191 RepID=A0A224YKN5_9ACAR